MREAMETVPSVRSKASRSFESFLVHLSSFLLYGLALLPSQCVFLLQSIMTEHCILTTPLRPAVCHWYHWGCGNRPRVRVQTPHNRYQACIEQAKIPTVCESTRAIQYTNVSCYTIRRTQVSLSANDPATETKLNRVAIVIV